MIKSSNNKNMTDKQQREKKVFTQFYRKAQLQVIPDSVKNQDPPAPDILCEIRGEGYVAFELVEILDEKFARRRNRKTKFPSMLHDYLDNMSQERSKAFKNKFSDTKIFFYFKEKTSNTMIEKSVAKIFEHLMSLDPAIEETKFRYDKELKQILSYATINRNESYGLSFESNAGGFVGDQSVNVLENKFKKDYKSGHRIELLAYIESNSKFPENHWIPDVHKYLDENFKNSCFKRIWFYDFIEDLIKLKYPGNDE